MSYRTQHGATVTDAMLSAKLAAFTLTLEEVNSRRAAAGQPLVRNEDQLRGERIRAIAKAEGWTIVLATAKRSQWGDDPQDNEGFWSRTA